MDGKCQSVLLLDRIGCEHSKEHSTVGRRRTLKSRNREN